MSALSQTAPLAVLPIFSPEAVVISGVVSACSCGVPMRRPRSMPLTMLPHWSEPPICRRQSIALVQHDEIIGLQDHVVEFDKAHLLVALEPELDRIHRQHAVDREMPADVAQHLDPVQFGQPFGIVGHDRVGLPSPKRRKLANTCLMPSLLRSMSSIEQDLARLVLAGGIADPGGAAAHQRDRLVAGLLQPVQAHDLHHGADMQRRRGAVETDIGRRARPGPPARPAIRGRKSGG